MNFQELSSNNAMIGGSDFWVIPDNPNSDWVKQIDWHCNFQLAKTQYKELRFLSDSIKEISKEQEYGIEDIRCGDDSPIMIVAETYVPAKYVIQLPFKNKEDWLSKIQKIQEGLGSRKPRVFLPKGFTKDQFYDLGKTYFSSKDDLSFVLS